MQGDEEGERHVGRSSQSSSEDLSPSCPWKGKGSQSIPVEREGVSLASHRITALAFIPACPDSSPLYRRDFPQPLQGWKRTLPDRSGGEPPCPPRDRTSPALFSSPDSRGIFLPEDIEQSVRGQPSCRPPCLQLLPLYIAGCQGCSRSLADILFFPDSLIKQRIMWKS